MNFRVAKRSIFKYSLLLFILASLAFVGALLFDLDSQFDWKFDLSLLNLSFAVAFQLVSIGVIILSWQLNLYFHDVRNVTFAESSSYVGLNSIGKYAPGKIFGSVVRATVIYRKTGNAKAILGSSIIEQIATIHSGFIIILLLLSFREFGAIGVILSLGFSIFSVIFFADIKNFILKISIIQRWFASVSGQIKSKNGKSKNDKSKNDKSKNGRSKNDIYNYVVIIVLSTIIWILASFSLYYCVIALDIKFKPELAYIVLATCCAYLTGFFAIFSPGGIGVREGVLIGFLSPALGVSLAIAVSILYRLITVSLDLFLGFYAFVYNQYFADPGL